MSFEVQVIHSINEIDPFTWDKFSRGRPFSSHRWYLFGETVMDDCRPVHILIWQEGKIAARATFWVIHQEPVSLQWKPLRNTIEGWLKKRPLFACRSPLANTSGLILTEGPLRHEALIAINAAALKEARDFKASFFLYDFLDTCQAGSEDWEAGFRRYKFADPGTVTEIIWNDFEDYLASLTAKERKHYRQRCREAERSGLEITRNPFVPNIDEAVPLIRYVERRHDSTPNPWAVKMLRSMDLVNSTWLTIRSNGRLLGCELVLEDNGAMMVTALGLAEGISDIYHLLGYADIRYAIEKKACRLHWGSGSYETKRRMGFGVEDNNHVNFFGLNPFSRLIARLAAK
jgi:predicted N-acyltransferase